jgi:ATP-dependent DNA helicase PIF1
MRDSDKPFGGLCLILVGDFCQLPPVTKKRKIPFLFESKTFWHVITEIVQLTKCFRQEDQPTVDLLNRLRIAKLTPEDHAKFQECLHRDLGKHGIIPTRFYGTNLNVDSTNRRELE